MRKIVFSNILSLFRVLPLLYFPCQLWFHTTWGQSLTAPQGSKAFFRSFFFCPHNLVLSHSIIYMSQMQRNKEDGKQKDRHSLHLLQLKCFWGKWKKKTIYAFLQAKPQIMSIIMALLGTGEKGIDSCLYQELIYIEFCQCTTRLKLVQITIYSHTRF